MLPRFPFSLGIVNIFLIIIIYLLKALSVYYRNFSICHQAISLIQVQLLSVFLSFSFFLPVLPSWLVLYLES